MTSNQIQKRNVALASGTFVPDEEKRAEDGKLSSAMAMLLGVLGTLELMIAGAMIFNIDVRATDTLALIFAFLVLYFGVVAILTDK